MRELTQSWRDLFLVFRIALDVRKLLVGLLMLLTVLVVGALLLGTLMWAMVDYQRGLEEEPRENEMAHFGNLTLVEEGHTFPGLLVAAVFEQDAKSQFRLGQVFQLTMADLGAGQWPEYFEPRGVTTGKVFLFIGAALLLWFLLAPQLASLCRIAAVEIARDERLELATANRFARKKWGSLFFAPVMLWAFVALIFLLIALWGLIGSIPWAGPIIAVLLLPFALFGGFLMVLALLGFVAPAVTWLGVASATVALLLWLVGATTAEGAALTTVAVMLSTGGIVTLLTMIIMLGGSPLIAPALATEGTDSFDSLSRAYNYFFSRFWHFLGYAVVGTVFGILCIAFVWVFTTLILALAFLPAQWAWGEPVQRFLWALTFQTPEIYLVLSLGAEVPFEGGFSSIWEIDGVTMWLFALLGGIIVAFVLGFALAFAVAYTTTMWTMIYFLLRHGVDGTDANEVYIEDDVNHWLAPPADVEKRLSETATATTAPASTDEQATNQQGASDTTASSEDASATTSSDATKSDTDGDAEATTTTSTADDDTHEASDSNEEPDTSDEDSDAASSAERDNNSSSSDDDDDNEASASTSEDNTETETDSDDTDEKEDDKDAPSATAKKKKKKSKSGGKKKTKSGSKKKKSSKKKSQSKKKTD